MMHRLLLTFTLLVFLFSFPPAQTGGTERHESAKTELRHWKQRLYKGEIAGIDKQFNCLSEMGNRCVFTLSEQDLSGFNGGCQE